MLDDPSMIKRHNLFCASLVYRKWQVALWFYLVLWQKHNGAEQLKLQPIELEWSSKMVKYLPHSFRGLLFLFIIVRHTLLVI